MTTMTSTTPRTADDDRYARYRSEEILVACPHMKLIHALLGEAGVEDYAVEDDDALGLSRITFADASSAVTALTALTARERTAGETTGEVRPEGEPAGVILAALREICRARFGGWEPLMGKNRVVDRVGVVNGIVIHSDGVDPGMTDVKMPERKPGRGKGAVVGILDGVIHDHPWFGGAVRFGYQDTVPEKLPPVAAGHATFVCGMVLQSAPGAEIIARAVLDADGQGDTWEVAREIVRLGNSGIDVLNLSFGCFTADNRPPLALQQAIGRVDPKVVIVAAAGNYSQDDHLKKRPFWPAALDGVVAVGAVRKRNMMLEPVDFSPKLPWVDVEAVGKDVVSTYLLAAELTDGKGPRDFDGKATWRGTSFSAATVAGLIAAGIVPGHMSAQEAWGDFHRALQKGNEPGGIARDPEYLEVVA